MKFIEEAEAQARLGEILDEAQRQPIVIRRRGQDTAAIVSIADYERLRLADVSAFLQARNDAAQEAAEHGLTEERLKGLIASNES
jgi:prevent-host-death family protein